MTSPWRVFWLLVLCFHGVAASAWWWLMPGGFPFSHPRFWGNSVAPVVVLIAVATAVLASRRQRLDVLRTALVAFPLVWGGAALGARAAFPITFAWLFVVPLLGALLMGVVWSLTFRRLGLTTGLSVWWATIVAFSFGASLPFVVRAPAPDTRPLNVPMPEPIAGPAPQSGRVGPRLFVHVGDGSATVKAGRLALSVQPLLRFLSRSPDGCLTILARPGMREGPDLRLTGAVPRGGGLDLRYRADYEASLWAGPDSGTGPVVLEGVAGLPRSIASHLNSFCDIEVSGHRRLFLSFSPCPDRLVEVLPADYPVGRPLRMAYLDAGGGFYVVEATSGEKGPFRELAGGRLGLTGPLAVTLHDGETAVARVTLDDWASQVGTALSPTAGWGVPVNAIEFSLQGNSPGSTAGIYTTLAGTSVGRGWDSVSHKAGTYRNRMKIEALDSEPPAR